MVYVALFGAIAMQNAGFGVLYMAIQLGTVPMMSSVIYINSYLTIPIRNKIQKVIPYVAVIMGYFFIFRGVRSRNTLCFSFKYEPFVQENHNVIKYYYYLK
jgi:sulfite exporter TauE/SafE